ncbi:alpha/beta hydrolase [Jonesia quinghaiensis]|uniref:alpha/beta hydrolase n=1 Tax=Jonesia quinghaiensis TaxID=262806 RepID=UPI0003F64D66|nr:alpha/beta hydrolase [Jonesia quinghaiensis]
MTSRPMPRLAAVGAILALTLAACSQEQTEPTEQESTTQQGKPAGTVQEGFETYYEQSVAWEQCGGGTFQCADITAPMDWNDPESETITIAAQMYEARGDAKGTVIINPGGPGGSGVELVGVAPLIFGEDLLENYNVLGFDPRGVSASSAVTCYDAPEMDRYLSLSVNTVNEKTLPILQEEADKFAQACLDNTGDLLGHVDTISSARDVDLLRSVMGDEKLHYLGFSYGTQLGATYAGLFPENVGRMVLDGAIDPRLTPFEQTIEQAQGFESSLRLYVDSCLSTPESCPLTGTTDEAMEQISELLDDISATPLQTDDPDGRVLTRSLAFYGVAYPMYAPVIWDQLSAALDSAMNTNDGSLLLDLSDQYFGREDGEYTSNQTEAFNAINCMDSRGTEDLAGMDEEAQKIVDAAPVMGESFTYGGVGCANWPFDVVESDYDMAAPGAAPILVVGTTNDPATPYKWAEGLAEVLESGVLITSEGDGHTAYGQSTQCIIDTVDAYFVDGTVPETDPVCS